MAIKLGVVMDPMTQIQPKKDTTLAMLLAAQKRGWQLYYMELSDLFLRDGHAHASMRGISVRDEAHHWCDFGAAQLRPLGDLDILLMRKDPPFDTEYVFATYLLERAQHAGVMVVNNPRGLRDVNEKLYTAWFPQCTPPTLVARNAARLREFVTQQGDVIIKPLDRMGGASVFRVREGDANTSVILETMTALGNKYCMAQRFIPEISDGDKRILLIDGEPVPYALARLPAPGEIRGNLAAGGSGKGVALSVRDRWICAQVGPILRERGLIFVGLDVIGDYLTEINVTSPTCLRELDALYGLDIAGQFLDRLTTRLN